VEQKRSSLCAKVQSLTDELKNCQSKMNAMQKQIEMHNAAIKEKEDSIICLKVTKERLDKEVAIQKAKTRYYKRQVTTIQLMLDAVLKTREQLQNNEQPMLSSIGPEKASLTTNNKESQKESPKYEFQSYNSYNKIEKPKFKEKSNEKSKEPLRIDSKPIVVTKDIEEIIKSEDNIRNEIEEINIRKKLWSSIPRLEKILLPWGANRMIQHVLSFSYIPDNSEDAKRRRIMDRECCTWHLADLGYYEIIPDAVTISYNSGENIFINGEEFISKKSSIKGLKKKLHNKKELSKPVNRPRRGSKATVEFVPPMLKEQRSAKRLLGADSDSNHSSVTKFKQIADMVIEKSRENSRASSRSGKSIKNKEENGITLFNPKKSASRKNSEVTDFNANPPQVILNLPSVDSPAHANKNSVDVWNESPKNAECPQTEPLIKQTLQISSPENDAKNSYPDELHMENNELEPMKPKNPVSLFAPIEYPFITKDADIKTPDKKIQEENNNKRNSQGKVSMFCTPVLETSQLSSDTELSKPLMTPQKKLGSNTSRVLIKPQNYLTVNEEIRGSGTNSDSSFDDYEQFHNASKLALLELRMSEMHSPVKKKEVAKTLLSYAIHNNSKFKDSGMMSLSSIQRFITNLYQDLIFNNEIELAKGLNTSFHLHKSLVFFFIY